MPKHLSTRDADFEYALAEILNQKREESADVDEAVAAIISQVRTRGDEALFELTQKYDRLALTAENVIFTHAEIDEYCAQVSKEDREALVKASERIHAYHVRQRPANERWKDETGAELGWRWTAVSSAGLYVPGGLASYPSSVLMNAIPAKVAGVDQLAIAVPTPDGIVNPLVLFAAKLAGVDVIYRIGGAQAIAALAYGTQSRCTGG